MHEKGTIGLLSSTIHPHYPNQNGLGQNLQRRIEIKHFAPCFDQAFLHDLSTSSSPLNFTVMRVHSGTGLFHLDFTITNTGWNDPLGTKPLQY